jgi:hypothetical protein
MLGIRQSTLWIQQLDTGSMAVEWLNGSWNIFDSLGISRYINILLKIPREEDTHRIFFWCRRRLFLVKSQGQTESYRCNSGGERIQVVANFKVHGPSLILKRLERQETYGSQDVRIHSSSLTWLFGKSMNISKSYFLYAWICWLSPTLLINTSS